MWGKTLKRALVRKQWVVSLPFCSTYGSSNRSASSETIDLKGIVAKKLIAHQKIIKKFRENYGNKVIGEITIDQVYGGMRGMSCLVTETSCLDPEQGIRFRGLSIPECRALLPKAPRSQEPLPEGIFWLLLTGDIPTEEQARSLSRQWAETATLPKHVVSMLSSFPSNLHPMSQLSAAISACSTESTFSRAYRKGISKANHWEYVFDDAMSLIAKLPPMVSTIYRNLYKEGSRVGAPYVNKDWSYNLASMMGYEDSNLVELLRLFLAISSDHEGGNACAHTVHLVGSTLADPYLAYAAGMNAFSGPLHGLAMQEVLVWLKKVQSDLGCDASDDDLRNFVWKMLKSGQVIPGYGHAVLRKTDPRYLAFREFAMKNFPEDSLFQLACKVYRIVPEILSQLGKVKNPWPNIDALSGTLLQHCGLKELQFYTVLFGMSRALGVMASLIWDRGLGLPLERPKSVTTEGLLKLVATDEPHRIPATAF